MTKHTLQRPFQYLVIIGMLLLLSAPASIAQIEYYQEQEEETTEDGPSFWDRTYFGGNFGLQFGNYTFVNVSPLMGYMITEKVSAGVGATYQYYSYNNRGYRFRGSTYGGRVFTRYNFTRQFFGHAEVESLNLQFLDTDNNIRREWVPGVFVGGGYFAPIGQRGGFHIMALYNLAHDEMRSPYGSPVVVRMGFVF